MPIMRITIDTSNFLVTERNLNAINDNRTRSYAPSFLIVTEHSGDDHKCTSAQLTDDRDGAYIQMTDPFGETDRVKLEEIQMIEVFWQ